jgi:FixJ family two-component response regulator
MNTLHATVHVVDDDDSLRRALTRLLTVSGYQVRGYACAEDLLGAAELAEGCILLDLGMPGLSGVQLQAHLNARGNVLPIIFLTGQGDIPTSVAAIKAGAEDFLCKPVDETALLAAIERALAGFRADSASRAAQAGLARRLALLSPRERQVFDLVIMGLLNKQIADRLGTSERTVKAHRAAITDKLQMRSAAEMVALASQLRLIP